MAHVAPTSHRRASRSSRRRRGTNQTGTNQPRTSRGGAHQAGARRAATDRAGAGTDQHDDWVDGPIQTRTWLGLTFAFVLGLVLTAQAHVGVHAAGITLLVMLVPLTVGVFVTAFRRGFGSGTAALTTGAALAFVLLKFFF
ncbi:hypothetical protein [Kribbella sp. NPDC055071]